MPCELDELPCGGKSPLAKAASEYAPEFAEFPQGECCDAACVAYNIIDAPPNKYSFSNDPIPMVRFMFAGKPMQSPKGAWFSPVKWTEFVVISRGEKTKFAKLFSGVRDAFRIMTEDEAAIFKMPFQIIVNPKANPMYSEITHVKDGRIDVSDIFYRGKTKFSPYQKYYGVLCPLRFASIKTSEGIISISEFGESLHAP